MQVYQVRKSYKNFLFLIIALLAGIAAFLNTTPAAAAPMIASATTSHDWSMYDFGSQHTNANPYETTVSVANASRLAPAWHQPLTYSAYAPTSIAHGIAYTSDQNGLAAFDATTGKVLWKKSSINDRSLDSAPLIAKGLLISEPGMQGEIVAYDATTGKTVWTHEGLIGPAPLTYSSDKIYVGTLTQIYALDVYTGKTAWSYNTGGTSNAYVAATQSAPAIANGIVYTTISVVAESATLLALDAKTGKKLWQYNTGRSSYKNEPNYISGSPSVANGLVYFDTVSHTTEALNATTGKHVWTASTGDSFASSSPTLANGVVYSYTGHALYAFDGLSGKKLWLTTLKATGTYPTGPRIAIANGVIYAGQSFIPSTPGTVLAFDARTGKQIWHYSIAGTRETYSPILVNSTLYIGFDANLYAFKLH
ncbi:hypothetical protein KDH_23060 [Dictyobacter sp. S3.2.2.5]|uniref:Pyrrolo-quinoline quinone repeat domain-containing protein n=1 Tax=Dictyobacter halimunensis TaxID=3026934 RepID=A0ABQ6FST4_9CHLR|nr:hypothetical protein KDH_23060 [Dictyobacter sp. S3.2.2.5]